MKRNRLNWISASEYDRGLEANDTLNTEQTRQEANQHDRAAGERQQRPGSEKCQLSVPVGPSEESPKPDTKPIAKNTDDGGLEKHHTDDVCVRRSHRLERTELFDVLDGEVVEGLTRDRGSDNEPEHDCGEKVDRDPCIE